MGVRNNTERRLRSIPDGVSHFQNGLVYGRSVLFTGKTVTYVLPVRETKCEAGFALREAKVRSSGIGKRLESVRGHFTQQDMAAQLDINVATWGRYEREERLPDAEFLLLLQEKKGINPGWLLTGQGSQISGLKEEEAAVYGDLVRIPLFDVQAKAGHGAVVVSEKIVDSLAFRADFLRHELSANRDDLYLIHVEGDSMEPTLRAGDVILVDHRRTRPDREGIYVLRMDDALLVKRLQLQPGGRVVAISDNATYRPFDLDLKAVQDGLAIVGRVVWAGRRF